MSYIVNGNGKVNIDFVGRFENLQSDFDVVVNLLGIKSQQLPHINITKKSIILLCMMMKQEK
jgi:hypothetical protein